MAAVWSTQNWTSSSSSLPRSQSSLLRSLSLAPSLVPRYDTTAKIEFYNPDYDGETPVVDALARGAEGGGYGAVKTQREIRVEDIRGNEDHFQLETTGFQVVQHHSAVLAEHSHALADHRDAYFEECEQLLRDL